jgi:energy-coupling factor transport system permease protein
MLHPITWVVWTVVVAAASMMTRNPLYLSILLGTVIINYLSAGQGRPEARGWRTLIRVAFGLALLIVPFNALNVHAGSHVLFRLPSHWPLIGGNITLEAVVWGGSTALGLLTLIALFATFNLQIDQAQMLRLTPAFIYEAGLIVSIALTTIPQMMVSAREIREAQLIRGHRMRRLRDFRPYLMALLTTGLERSFQLAESMEARGFGNVRALPSGRDVLYKGLTLLGLAGVLSSTFALTYYNYPLAWAGVLLSAILLLGVFWAQGKRVQRTHYHRDRWTWRDGAVLAVCLLVAGVMIAARMRDAEALVYYPYTQLLPPFLPWLGIALLAAIVPAFIQQTSRNQVFDRNLVSGEEP